MYQGSTRRQYDGSGSEEQECIRTTEYLTAYKISFFLDAMLVKTSLSKADACVESILFIRARIRRLNGFLSRVTFAKKETLIFKYRIPSHAFGE